MGSCTSQTRRPIVVYSSTQLALISDTSKSPSESGVSSWFEMIPVPWRIKKASSGKKKPPGGGGAPLDGYAHVTLPLSSIRRRRLFPGSATSNLSP